MLIALETPLAQSYAVGLSQERFFELLGDVENLAGRAETPLREGTGEQRLRALLRNDEAVHDSKLLAVDTDGRIVFGSHRQTRASAGEIRRATSAALAGQSADRPHTAWPWRPEPFVLTAAVGRDSGTVGAVIAVAPTSTVRREIAERLAILAACGLPILLLATFLCALPLARWVLRPVRDLTAAAQHIAAGKPEARVPEDGGPAELRGLAAAFNRMAAAVAAALERQRAFAADASHQLRNPLTALRLRMDNLALHIAPSGERELKSALSEAGRLTVTIDVLLRLARAEATAAELVVIDIAQTTSMRIDAWRQAFADARTPLQLSSPSVCHARYDATAIEQALDAVFDNARKFGRRTAVDVTVASQHEEVCIRVRDHGPGLSDKERRCAVASGAARETRTSTVPALA